MTASPQLHQAIAALTLDWRNRAAAIRDKHRDNKPILSNASAAGAAAFEIAADELETLMKKP